MWQIRYAPNATAGIHRVPRGPAAHVTAAIRALATDPRIGEPVDERPNTYRIKPEGHIVEYELLEANDPQLILVLNID
jgi:hypothetical protein